MTPAEANSQGLALHAIVEAGGTLTGIARWKHAVWVAGGVWVHAAEAAGVKTVQRAERVALRDYAHACRELARAEGDELARHWGPSIAADTCPAWPFVAGGSGKPTSGIIAAADAAWRGDARWYRRVNSYQRATVLRLLSRLGLKPGEGAGR